MSLYYGYKKQEKGIGGLPTTGGEMTEDINIQDNHILTSADPTENSHLARKKYVDNLITNHTGVNYLAKTGSVMTGNISMGNNKITTTKNPTGVKDLARKKYVDDQDARRLPVTGGTMSGNIIMGNNKIQTTSDPTGDKDLSHKKYVDDQDSKKLSLTGGTMTGNLNMGSNKVLSSATPSNNNDLTTKSYVDGNFLGKTKESYLGSNKDTLKADIYTKNFQVFCKQNPNTDDSLTRKKYIYDNFLEMEKVSWLGTDRSKIKRDIYTDQKQVLTSRDPDYQDALSRKKYVDDRDNTRLSLSGGTMTGDITIGNNKIISSSDPTLETHLTRKKYVDDRNNATLQVIYTKSNEKLSLIGGTMTGDLDMGNHNILHAANYVLSSDQHVVNRKYVTNWSLPNTVANIYNLQMDDEGIFEIKDDIDYIEYTGSDKKIEKLLNLSRKKDWEFTQSDTNKQPLFKKSTINNNFYCIQYPASNAYNFHLSTSQDILSNQHLNFYFVYGLKSLNLSHNEVSLFKITSNETTNQLLPFDFGVSYRNSFLYITNSSRNTVPNSNWELKANVTQINKLICLSSHWDQNNLSGVKKGNLYVNGKEIVSFTTNQKLSHNSNTKFYLGSKNKEFGKMDGEILYVYISTRKMKEKEIVLNHYLLCKKYGVDFDEEEVINYL